MRCDQQHGEAAAAIQRSPTLAKQVAPLFGGRMPWDWHIRWPGDGEPAEADVLVQWDPDGEWSVAGVVFVKLEII